MTDRLTPEQIQQARRWATWALDDEISKFPTEMQDAAEDLARAVLALTEQLEQARGATEQWKSCFEALTDQQQPKPVSREELSDAIVVGLNVDEPVSGFAYEAAGELLSRYTITHKEPTDG